MRLLHRYVAVALALTGALLGGEETQTAAASPPADAPLNVLLITIDDLNDWIEPLGGHPQAVTPHLNRLSARGATFTNAHTASPACAPSRAAILTGVAPHRSGVYQNWANFRHSAVLDHAVTLPQAFRTAGYHALGGGKVFHAPNRRPAGWNSDPASWNDYFTGNPERAFFLPPEGQSHMQPDTVGKLDWHAITDDQAPPLDEQIVEWAAGTLAGGELPEPFFMAVGFLKPHEPFFAPQHYFDMHPLDQVELPQARADDRADIPSIAYALDPFLVYDYDDHVREVGNARELVRAYLACVSYVDACVGRVIAALDEAGLAERTLVVVMSDHGFHLGEKQHWGKFSLWEESTRSPLFVAGPGIDPGIRIDAAVSLLDVYPTLLDMADLPPRRGLDGVSLVPLLDNPRRPWNEPVLTTSSRKNHAIRSNDWRYILYNNGRGELYHLAEDPHEWTNLIDADTAAAKRARGQLHEHLPADDAEELY